MRQKNVEVKCIFTVTAVLFTVFLLIPMILILRESLAGDSGFTLEFYSKVLGGTDFLRVFARSVGIAMLAAVITTVLAFILAYAIHFTNLPSGFKKAIHHMAVLPMLLPTITYGFAIIYSLGKQGLITKLLGRQLFDIYGINGLLLGYVMYTLPISFLLISNTMGYIDKKFLVVSRVMGDSPARTFLQTVVRPLWGTLAASAIQAFFLSFTDFGIPASVGGRVETVAGRLYSVMLGSVPDFGSGAVIALMMLLPSIVSIAILGWLGRYNIRYSRVSDIEMKRSRLRDFLLAAASALILLCVLSIFAVIIIVPFIDEWPYRVTFTLEHFEAVFSDSGLSMVIRNSLLVAALTAVFGTLLVYGAALVTARSTISTRTKSVIESISLVTNTIPGMVLGIAFLLAFSGTPIQGTVAIIVCCNLVHFFSTPYLMMKSSLEKMNSSWEQVARLMGDSWLNTVVRVITPNAMSTIIEVFSYYFVNAMVTVSAIIFITGARTMVITTKIKELQHFAKFDEIFVLSLLLLLINIAAKMAFGRLADLMRTATDREQKITLKEKIMKKRLEKKKVTGAAAVLFASVLAGSAVLSGCGQGSAEAEQVIIYSNADDEAVVAMKNALDAGGYEGQYVFQTFGTSELGGKLLAEGTDIEADLVTMSSFYVESAQDKNSMFKDLTFETNALEEYPAYYTPITSQEGAIILNTEMMKENNLPEPTSLKDLSDPAYKGFLSVVDIDGSSTAWLMVQALISEYGEDGAKEVLSGIYDNAGDHIEESGSGPIKKVRAGEVAVGFGLRHQAVADKADGLPVDFVDPVEGNFSLTESVAVVDKGDKTNELAMEMAECIIKNGRAELLETYPNPLYEGETADSANVSAYPKKFAEKLTVELLEKHRALAAECK